MNFTSLTFVLFLTLVFAAYWIIRNRTSQNSLLIVASYCFYAWWDWRFCSLMLISSVVDYFVGLGLGKTDRRGRRRALLIVSLFCNLGMLGFFKYCDFFIGSFQDIMHQFGMMAGDHTLRIVLPVGISFYTFQTLSYSIDIFRKRIEPTKSFIDYCAYVTFFPQLVAGPIERAGQLLPQFTKARTFDRELAEDGCRRILWGFYKKMVLADGLGLIVGHFYGNLHSNVESSAGPGLALATVCFAFQIYCDFSAYSDIAIGTARLFGFKLMRNFAYPYLAQSISEFWRRWHISLSTWFRDYVYVPLGGSRVGKGRRAFNIIVTFTVSGFWHGAAWHFVVWGLLNGLGMLPQVVKSGGKSLRVEDTPGGEGLLPKPAALGRILLTFFLICITWVFFRAESMGDAFVILRRIATGLFDAKGYAAVGAFFDGNKDLIRVMALLGGFIAVEWLQRRREHLLDLPSWPRWLRWSAYTAMFWVALDLGTKESGAFIYFQF